MARVPRGLCVLPDEEPCGLARTGDTALRMCRLPEEFCADPAKGTPVALDTKGTVRDARGLASKM